jgi:hypothetical protein
VRAIVVKNGKLEVVIGARWLEVVSPSAVRLRSSRAYASAASRHRGDVALAHDVLDRQVVDADGVQILRPSDIYLAAVGDRIELVGIEVGVRALARRLGPRRLRGRVRVGRAIDWGSISAFAPREPGKTGAMAATPRSRAKLAPAWNSAARPPKSNACGPARFRRRSTPRGPSTRESRPEPRRQPRRAGRPPVG